MERYLFPQQERKIIEGLHLPVAVYQFVEKKVVTLILSDGFCKLFGYEDRAKAYYDMDHDMYKDAHPDDVARIANAAFSFATDKNGVYDVVYRTRKKNSDEYTIVHAKGSHFFTDTGVRLAQVWYTDEGIYSDDLVDQDLGLARYFSNAIREASLLKSSQFDYLTGLPNMTYFFELAEIGRDKIMQCGGDPALLFIDLSGMKFFNSKHGFSEGDNLLRKFAKLLISYFNSENCCHISGDHFAVYVCSKGLEEKLRKLFKEFEKMNGTDSLPVRVGIFKSSCEEIPISVACDRAKIACDAIRNTYESSFNYYDTNLRDEAERRQYVLMNIDKAIENGWIKVYYQPIVRSVNGKICDEEALARWIDPEKGFLSPAYFIPPLEESGQIYKLDICMLEQVLEKMNKQKSEGSVIVPHSINISRSDFEACDIVEEVRKRVDAAGIGHDKITIEVTESAVGSNFDFMKDQILRFQALGFPVWMDDFGSGYSSMDVLSSINFNLLKFDMVFMRKFNIEESRKVILTELMRMATSLGVDTVCEGVETEEQVRFLQEIGCSKLQGFYFSKPLPYEVLREEYETGKKLGYENPAECDYYDAMGRVNLYDLTMVVNSDDKSFNNFFNTIPMGIIERKGDGVRFVRSNPSYRKFMRRYFGVDIMKLDTGFSEDYTPTGTNFMAFVSKCCENSARMVYDEQMPDGSIVHSLARKVAFDEVSGRTAVAVAVLSITEPSEGTTYAAIARALASNYYNIYYVNMETENYIEYSTQEGIGDIAAERHGEKFFEAAKRDTLVRIYEDDRERFLADFTKENILRELDESGVYMDTYRVIDTGEPVYVNMKITRMMPGSNQVIIGISVIDSMMKKHEADAIIQREETAYARVMALSGGYLGLYTVDLATGNYIEYSVSGDLNESGLTRTGEDFFYNAAVFGEKIVYPEDLELFLSRFTKDSVLKEIEEKGDFQLKYRIIRDGEPKRIILKAVALHESGKDKLIVGARLWKER